MINLIKKSAFWQGLLLASVILFFVDIYLLFGAFFITIPLVFVIGIIAIILAIKEKDLKSIIINLILILIPIVFFFVTPW